MLIDSHCHLTSEALFPTVHAVIHRAVDAGVTEFVTIATDLEDAVKAIALSDKYRPVHVVAGVHPHEAGKTVDGWDARLLDIARRDDVFGVGEMGLDYHYDFSDRAAQHRVFRRQLEIAVEVGKPVVIHSRDAHSDVMEILRDIAPTSGAVFHCFTGTRGEADDILDAGYWLSLTGVVTFRRSDGLREIARSLPADRIMVETDSPYLSPEPVRNVRPNEPVTVVHTAACIAQVRGISAEELAALATANTRRFFRLPNE
ncbi:MAG: TatD family hydrolase [Phycisphaerae bacterium]|nr:TatD family hydrolase [Phycisphaerae bacterium]